MVLRGAEIVAATMMAAMFLTFILQIAIRYSAKLEWLAQAFPILEPSRYGWTLELCLALWVWIVFWGAAFVVRERDHVTFDVIYGHVSPRARRWFAIIGRCRRLWRPSLVGGADLVEVLHSTAEKDGHPERPVR
jgi:C4-dicarboxylate transporter DctQ subunit